MTEFQNHPHHDISFSLGITQIWVQPVHQCLNLLPVEEDEEDEKQKVQNTEACREQKIMSEDKEN